MNPKKLFTTCLSVNAVAILIIAQTNLGAQQIDSLHARMSVTISSVKHEPDKDGVMRVSEEGNIEYSTELVMKVGLLLNQIDDPSRHEGYWDNLYAVGGTSYEQYFNYSKSQEPVYTRMSPLLAHSVHRKYGFRKCEGSRDPGPGEWGLVGYSELSDQIRTQYASAYFKPYNDPYLASLTSIKPTHYVLVIRGPTVIEEMVKGSKIFTISNQEFSSFECQLKELDPNSFTSVIPVEDSFTDWIPGEDQVTPPLVKADIIDNYLLNPKGVLALSLSGKIFRKRSDRTDIYESSTTISITLSPEPFAAAEVRLDGCSELGVGELGIVTATGKPEGGTYRFWCEPEGMLTIQSDGSSSVVIKGASPGRGTLYVEYTKQKGNTAQASQQAMCVKIDSYNGGEAIPQIALYDVDGKKKSGILTVPVKAQPADAVELVRFEPANPGILSAVGVGSEVTLQGIKIGKTTLQAKTKCGGDTGAAVEVEVVNCDDETIARLEKMKKAAIENLVATTKDLQKHAGSKEFIKARDDLVSSTIELLAKVGLTIITGGKTTGTTRIIEIAAEIADKGSAFSEIIGSSNLEELGENIAKPVSGEAFERIIKLKFGDAAKELYGKSLGAIIGIVEVGQAGNRFYKNIGQIVHYEEMLEKILKMMEKVNSELKLIESRQQICSRQKGESSEPEIPMADLHPVPDKQSPPTKPATKPADPPVQEQKNDQSTEETPTTGDEIPIDPDPPTIPPQQVGLPYEPDDCGCNSSKNLTVISKDFSILGAGIKNLGECVESLISISVTDYQNALTELSELTESLSLALETDASDFLVKAKESKPQLDAIINRVKSYDEAGKDFLDKMGKCAETVATGMDVLKSVEQITVESIKTNY